MDGAVAALLRHGAVIVFGWVFTVQVGVPIPTVPLLLAVGVLAGLGRLSLGWALLAALGGSLVADLLWYGIGRRWGGRVFRGAVIGHARELFLAHRLWALVIGKFFFEVNAAVAALAGSSGIRVGEFLAYDVASAFLWAGAWVGVGYVLKDGVRVVAAALAPLGVWPLVALLVGFAAYAALKVVERRRSHSHGVSP